MHVVFLCDGLPEGIDRFKKEIDRRDFGVSIDYQKKVVQMKLIPTSFVFKDAIKKQGGKISLFAQYQAELFWMFDVTEENVEINKKGYTCITLPKSKCVVGVVAVKG